MRRSPVSESTVQAILSMPKRVEEDISWNPKSGAWYECRLPVRGAGGRLQIIISVNLKRQNKFSISLLLDSRYPIRRLCVGGQHKNSHGDRARLSTPIHMHVWTDNCHDTWAYVPDNIPPTVTIRDAFDAFCRECRIELAGKWNDPPGVQAALFLV